METDKSEVGLIGVETFDICLHSIHNYATLVSLFSIVSAISETDIGCRSHWNQKALHQKLNKYLQWIIQGVSRPYSSRVLYSQKKSN